MSGKVFRLAMVGLVGFAVIAPLSGCDSVSEPKPTIDTSTPIKAPEVPSANKVEAKKPN